MKKELDNQSYSEANKSITYGVAQDLNSHLSSIKEKISLMMNSIDPVNPLQKHLDVINYSINESIKAANLLSSFAQVDEGFKIKN